jgi:hypothetical protein
VEQHRGLPNLRDVDLGRRPNLASPRF